MNEEGVSKLSSPTYFDTLPDDIRVKLAEWLDIVWYESPSTAPVYNGRIPFLRLLLSEDGPFRNVVSSVVTRVFWSLGRNSTNISIEAGSVHIGPELFEGEERGRGLVERVLKACGESTKKIWVVFAGAHSLHGGSNENEFIQRFASLAVQYCPAVESLEFIVNSRFPGDVIACPLFAQFSSQLRSIVWCALEPDNGLHLPSFTSCTQIRMLSLPVTPQLTSLLEHTGALLESLFLTFTAYEGCDEVIDAVEQNCRKLLHIRLVDSRRVINSVGEDRYAAFLCSYRTQLISAEIEGMVVPEHLHQVFAKCSNLNFESGIVEDHGIEEWERIRVFGPRIRVLLIDVIACAGEESSNAISSCTNLSELYSLFPDMRREQDVIDTATMSVLSSLSTPSLRKLSLIEFRATKENLAMIVAATSSLTSIELELAEPLHDGTVFKSIVDSNPHLREVRIVEDYIVNGERDEDSAVELLRALVCTFTKCRLLDFCILNTGDQEVDEETIRDICGSLPCRGIDLSVQIGSTSFKQRRRLGQELWAL